MRKLILSSLVAAGLAFSGTAIAADGAAIFKSKCQACHGADGAGSPMAPAFKANDWIKTQKEDVIAATIKNGRPAKESRFEKGKYTIGMAKQALSDDDLKAIVAHLKGLAGK
ncbi:MAG: cytochrome c [Deltaproteobacteria bacterium]